MFLMTYIVIKLLNCGYLTHHQFEYCIMGIKHTINGSIALWVLNTLSMGILHLVQH